MKLKLAICLILIATISSIYYQVFNFDFINFDDDGYVYENSYVLSGLNKASSCWALTTTRMANWHPVTWLSYMADTQMFGVNPMGYHLSNLFFHIINSILLFLLLCRITGALWRSCFVAFLFAVHPLHIESVAWIAERKDVLSCLFFLITIYLYSSYIEKPKLSKYIMALLAFAVGLMSKPMIVTLPFLLLLLDYWPLGRIHDLEAMKLGNQHSGSIRSLFNNVILEKIPFIMLSILSAGVTIFAQYKGNAVSSLEELPFFYRFENAIVAYFSYILKTVWPNQLSIIYPMSSLSTWEVIGSLLFLVFVSSIVIRYHKIYPYLLVGWFWFFISLLPVIGLLQVGLQKMADRYTYLPLVGLFIMIAWGMPELLNRLHYKRPLIAVVAVLIVLSLSFYSWRQVKFWENSEKLFTHALEVAHDGNFQAHNLLGLALLRQGRIDDAISQISEAVQINPKSPEMLFSLGKALAIQGKYDKAATQYDNAWRLQPNNAMANYNMGTILSQMGNFQQAVDFFLVAIKIDPDNYEARNNLGIAYAKLGKINEAITQFTEALRSDSQSSKINYNLGVTLAAQGRYSDADKYFKEALRIEPTYIDAKRDFEINRRRLLTR